MPNPQFVAICDAGRARNPSQLIEARQQMQLDHWDKEVSGTATTVLAREGDVDGVNFLLGHGASATYAVLGYAEVGDIKNLEDLLTDPLFPYEELFSATNYVYVRELRIIEMKKNAAYGLATNNTIDLSEVLVFLKKQYGRDIVNCSRDIAEMFSAKNDSKGAHIFLEKIRNDKTADQDFVSCLTGFLAGSFYQNNNNQKENKDEGWCFFEKEPNQLVLLRMASCLGFSRSQELLKKIQATYPHLTEIVFTRYLNCKSAQNDASRYPHVCKQEDSINILKTLLIIEAFASQDENTSRKPLLERLPLRPAGIDVEKLKEDFAKAKQAAVTLGFDYLSRLIAWRYTPLPFILLSNNFSKKFPPEIIGHVITFLSPTRVTDPYVMMSYVTRTLRPRFFTEIKKCMPQAENHPENKLPNATTHPASDETKPIAKSLH